MAEFNNTMFKIQQTIKNNSVDLQSVVSDIADWSEDIKEKEKAGKTKGSSG